MSTTDVISCNSAFLLAETFVPTFPQRELNETLHTISTSLREMWGGGEGVIEQMGDCPVPRGARPSLHAPSVVEIVYRDKFILPNNFILRPHLRCMYFVKV